VVVLVADLVGGAAEGWVVRHGGGLARFGFWKMKKKRKLRRTIYLPGARKLRRSDLMG
jgi:hypothetical protein